VIQAASEQTATTPWWGVSVIAGVFTVLGVLMSQLSTILLDRRRTMREQVQRWDVELRQLYARYLVEARRVRDKAVEYVDAGGGGRWPDIDPFTLLFQELEIIAHDEVLHPAIELRQAMLDIWRAAVQDLSIPNELFVEYVRTSAGFTVAARRSLGQRSIVIEFSDEEDNEDPEARSSEQ
jgi:hypothetical protein